MPAVIERFIANLENPCRMLVAVSGGSDSTGLLVALRQTVMAKTSIELVAATVDHGLRPGSAEEARSVHALCQRLGIQHFVLNWAGPKPTTGLQAAARAERYQLLADLAERERCDFIVTAHTADDQAETLAMRKTRSAEARTGIAAAVLFGRKIWVVRPLLDTSRDNIRGFLTSMDIGWIDDPSNDNMLFERVRVRKSLTQNGPLSGNGLRSEDRTQQATDAARFLRNHVCIHARLVAEIDLVGFENGNAAHALALFAIVAQIGGLSHLPGRATRESVLHFLRETKHGCRSAGRSVLDRRKDRMFVTRERRGLPELTVRPGREGNWDNRFAFSNRGSNDIVIGSGTDSANNFALLDFNVLGALPGAVRQRAQQSAPVVIRGLPADVEARPILPLFEQFLPIDLLPLANALASISGLEHFPLPKLDGLA